MALQKSQLLQKVIEAIRSSGWTVHVLNPAHPFSLIVSNGTDSYRIRVYIWTATHGGYPRSPNELRIQVTGLANQRFVTAPGEKTLVLGFHPETGVFVGFDVQKHLGQLGYSPSIQIRRDIVLRAADQGMATQDKGNDEIAIAIRPDFFGEYIRNQETLHGFAQNAADLAQLEAVIENPTINEEELTIGDTTRRTVVATLSRRMRDANFRRRVIRAYNNRCAMCGMQLGLVQAAHIVPVAHESSTDETSNGIALCANHHAAFDDGLVYIAEDYSIHVNTPAAAALEAAGLDGGLINFIRGFQHQITVPNEVRDRPHREYIRIGNQARNIRI